MRKTLGLLLGAVLALGVAGQAGARTIDWHGTIAVDLGALDSAITIGSGVATVNDSSGGTHLTTLRLDGHITGSDIVPVTDPNTTGQIKSIIISGTLGGELPKPLTATLTGISGAPPIGPLGKNTLPFGGFTRVCILLDDCVLSLTLNNTINSGNTGVGVGGVVTLGGNKAIRISIESAPWTLATITGLNQTVKGNFITLSDVGFVHGPGSVADSSTATASGVLQLVAPQNVVTSGILGNSTAISLFMTLTLHFIPEPGLLLLLGSGVVGLGLLGRSRMKK
jgi:hypothetical protein